MTKVRITIAAMPAISATVECDDWDEMDEDERQDFVLDEAREIIEKNMNMKVTHTTS